MPRHQNNAIGWTLKSTQPILAKEFVIKPLPWIPYTLKLVRLAKFLWRVKV